VSQYVHLIHLQHPRPPAPAGVYRRGGSLLER
jgi:hypothetical protein